MMLNPGWLRFTSTYVSPLLFGAAFLLLGTARLAAVGPDRSFWQLNLSGDSTNEVTVSEDPEIVVVGSTVHVLQTASVQTNTNHRRLIYRRSTDGGQTFQAPIVVESESGLEFSLGRFRRLAVDGNTVHIVSLRSPPYTTGTWYYVLEYYRSINNGASFEPRRTLASGDQAWRMGMSRLVAEGGKVTIAYLYYPNWYVNSHLNLLFSDDGGANFRSQTIAHSETEYIDLWDLLREGDKMAVALVSSAGIPGSWSYYYRMQVGASTNGGVNWSFNQVCSTNSAGWPAADSLSDYNEKPDLAWAGNHLFIAWTGAETNGIRSTFVARSSNNGVSFAPQVNLSAGMSGTPQYGQATIAARGNYAYVVWNMPNTGTWFSRSVNAGASWESPRLLWNGGWWPMLTIDPASADGSKVHFLASGAYRYSTDGGATLAGPITLPTRWDWWGSGQRSFQWSIGAGSTIHLAYFGALYPGSSGDYDLFYRRYDPIVGPLATNNQCLVLNGSNDEVHYENMQIPTTGVLFSNALTVEMWVQPVTNCPFDSTLLMQELPDDYRGALKLQTHAWSNGRRPSGKVMTTNGLAEVWGGELLADGEWHHVAMTYDAAAGSNNLRLYVDGHFSASATGFGPLKPSDSAIYVGGAAGSTYSTFRGSVNEVRLWNHALTETELRVHTTSRLRANEPGLIAYYPLDGSTKEITGLGRDGVLMFKETFAASTLPLQPIITSAPLTSGAQGYPFIFEVAADWATGFNIVSGSVPPGLNFNGALGQFTGTPATPGAYELVARATNDFGAVTQALRIVIADNIGTLFRDDLNNGTNASWQVIRDNAGYYSFYPGGMRLRAHWGDLWAGANNCGQLFTLPTPTTGDFTVTLGVSKFSPGAINYVQLFVTAYDDDNNHLRSSYGWANQRMLSVVAENAASPAGTNIPADFGERPFFLRLSKQNNLYLALWSTNGVDFIPSHEPMAYGDGSPAKLAFWLGIDPGQTNVAWIDSFEVKADAQPFITSPPLAGGAVGSSFVWQVAGPSAANYSATGLPTGLAIHPTTGLITGTPLQAGAFNSSVTVSNHNGSATQALRIVINDAARIVFREEFNNGLGATWTTVGDSNYISFLPGLMNLRANYGDTWQHYNRALNLFAVNTTTSGDFVATLGIAKFTPSKRDYPGIFLVAWDNTDNNVRFSYNGSASGTRSFSIAGEVNQSMTSAGMNWDADARPFAMRLAKEGNVFTTWWSTNGSDFARLPGLVVTNGDGTPLQVGFWMGLDSPQTDTMLIDYFEIASIPTTNTFDRWAAITGLIGSNAAKTADPDGDKIPNIVEYAFGLNPAQGGQGNQLPAGSIQAGFPTITYRQLTGGTGTTGVDYLAGGLRYVVEVCDTLGDLWQSGESIVEIVGLPANNGDGTQTVTVRLKAPLTGTTSKFLRVAIRE